MSNGFPKDSLILGLNPIIIETYQHNRGQYMARKTRSDCTVGTFEKKTGLPPGTIRNPDGRDTRSDKKIGTIRKEKQSEE